ncbi:hypothetical protein OG204_12190 [Streptomyces sp. NBC_01387]|uniref:hypothetical protein n=1 Tax=unclassified Streptomyces TaxID=2593676 RepID=UPI002024B346|nr:MULTISPECIES: hypothetical protein [unclassified Streptomyces]MCX4550996.1 hypothetical protein [Streptomyces sp. NBC_01500]WSC22413.1 hypothetical protein OIE60_23545 [Streptomyces sp. NBC_01766]WSV56256.1 hypothetical protein OG282_22615 [Streptomyces sp. NBC_01014]
MATDGWQQARESVLGLWRRVHPERVDAVGAELAEVRAELLAARRAGDEQTEAELAADWQRRLRRLLERDPSLGGELRRVLDEELGPLVPPPGPHSVTQRATVSGRGNRTFQAGGSITHHESAP